jgi:hypothetical protein
MFVNNVPTGIFRPKREELEEGWRNLVICILQIKGG